MPGKWACGINRRSAIPVSYWYNAPLDGEYCDCTGCNGCTLEPWAPPIDWAGSASGLYLNSNGRTAAPTACDNSFTPVCSGDWCNWAGTYNVIYTAGVEATVSRTYTIDRYGVVTWSLSAASGQLVPSYSSYCRNEFPCAQLDDMEATRKLGVVEYLSVKAGTLYISRYGSQLYFGSLIPSFSLVSDYGVIDSGSLSGNALLSTGTATGSGLDIDGHCSGDEKQGTRSAPLEISFLNLSPVFINNALEFLHLDRSTRALTQTVSEL